MPFYIDMCKCITYYILYKIIAFTRVVIHLKRHAQLVQDDMCRDSLEEIKTLVENEVCCTPNVKNFTIGFFMSKSFLSQHLFNEDGDNPIELLKGEHLNKVMDNFMPLCFPNICNIVVLFKHHPTNRGYIDNIFLFKSKNRYNYIQDNCFLRQVSNQKVFLFKDVY